MVDIAAGKRSGRRSSSRRRVIERKKKSGSEGTVGSSTSLATVKIAFGPSSSTGPVIANETSAARRVTNRRESEIKREGGREQRTNNRRKSDGKWKSAAAAS